MSFNASLSGDTSSIITPVIFGYENCASLHSFGPAVRTYYLIHFVVSGFGTFCIHEKEYKVEPGEIFVISPLAETYYCADAEKPWSYIWIGFKIDGELPAKLDDIIDLPKSAEIFEMIKEGEKLTGESLKAFLTARIWDIFSLLTRDKTEAVGYAEKALAIIHAEYMNDLTASELAARLCLDRSYFSVLFKKKTGVSPAKYLHSYRMRLAAQLLTQSRTSVTVAAHSVGYTDVFNFSKMFKRYYGVPPTDYAHRFSR